MIFFLILVFLLSFSIFFSFRYSITVSGFDETGYTWTFTPLHLLFLFSSMKNLSSPNISLKSDETQYTWCHPAFTIYPEGHNQNQINSYHHHSNLYLFPSLFFQYLSLVFRPFPTLNTFLHSPLVYLFPQLLKCKKCLVWWSSVNKEQNITTKAILSIWFIHHFII